MAGSRREEQPEIEVRNNIAFYFYTSYPEVWRCQRMGEKKRETERERGKKRKREGET